MNIFQKIGEWRLYRKGLKILKESVTHLCSVDLRLTIMLATGDFDRSAVDGEYISEFMKLYKTFHVLVRTLVMDVEKLFANKTSIVDKNSIINYCMDVVLMVTPFAMDDVAKFLDIASEGKFAEKDPKVRYNELITGLDFNYEKFLNLIKENERLADGDKEAIDKVNRSRDNIKDAYYDLVHKLSQSDCDRYSVQTMTKIFDTIIGIDQANIILTNASDVVDIRTHTSDAIPEF